jgi:hypothetical protein
MRLTLFLLSVLLLAGCGGSGGGGSSDPSPFAGDWAGAWETATQEGTAEVTITESGEISGTVVNTTSSLTAPITGEIQEDGTIEASYTYPGQSTVNGTGTFTLSNGNNTLSGTLTAGGSSADYVLNRVP